MTASPRNQNPRITFNKQAIFRVLALSVGVLVCACSDRDDSSGEMGSGRTATVVTSVLGDSVRIDDMILDSVTSISPEDDPYTVVQSLSSGFTTYRSLPWKSGIVPIYINPNAIDASNRLNFVLRVCSRWSEAANIHCVQRSNEKQYVEVVTGTDSGCAANVGAGRDNRARQLFLADECWTTKVVLHELGHIFGLSHEHQRWDRDSYIRILRENIESGKEFAFEKLGRESLETPYDFFSIMHYPSNAFGKTFQSVTIEPLPPYVQFKDRMGLSKDISETDGAGMQLIYGTPPPKRVTFENPAFASFQSGIGLISGWACEGERVEVGVNHGSFTIPLAYGTVRTDTQPVCGDSNNGFGALFNWNRLGTGNHRLGLRINGVEVASSTFAVNTLGAEFVRGLGSPFFMLPNFPTKDRTTRIQWEESLQNFVVTNSDGISQAGGTPSRGASWFENPRAGSFQSGISLISGWACDASRIEIDVDHGSTVLQAAYGTPREDTQGVCGDINNGYGLLWNWNLLGEGTHHLRVLADGQEIGDSTFTVATLGLNDSFPTGLQGTYRLSDFPTTGRVTTISWKESLQNFVIVAVE